MIARVASGGERQRISFVALCLDGRAGRHLVWSPIRGDLGRTGDAELRRAVRMCAASLARRYQALHANLSALSKRANRADAKLAHLAHALTAIDEQANRLGIEIARLLDEPTKDDTVRIDGRLLLTEVDAPVDESDSPW